MEENEKLDKCPGAKAVQLCNIFCNRIGQKHWIRWYTYAYACSGKKSRLKLQKNYDVQSREAARKRPVAPLRRADAESDCGPSSQEECRGGPTHKRPPTKFPGKRQLDEQKTLPRNPAENQFDLNFNFYKDREVQHDPHYFEPNSWNREDNNCYQEIQKT